MVIKMETLKAFLEAKSNAIKHGKAISMVYWLKDVELTL